MKEITDPHFIRLFFKHFSEQRISDRDLALCRIEVSGNSGVGLKLALVHRQRQLVELRWWPPNGVSAAWPASAAPMFRTALESRRDFRLTRLVRNFLRRHELIGDNGRSLFEVENEIEKVMAAIGALGEAIAAQDWTAARRIWADLARLQPLLVGPMPDVALHLDTVLKQNEAFARPQVGGVH